MMKFYESLLEKQNKENLFLIWDAKQMTYGEAEHFISHLSDKLSSHHIEKTVVGIHVDDPFLQILSFLAVEKAGAIPLLIHEYLEGETLEHFISEREIHFLLSEKGEEVIPSLHIQKYKEGTKEGNLFAVLSSGSSGIAKILFRTKESWIDFFSIQNKLFHVKEESVLFVQGSLAFTGNFNMVMGFLNEGATLVGSSKLLPKSWLKLIEEQKVTHIYMIPSKLSPLVRQKGSAASVTHILSGSELMTERILRNAEKVFPSGEMILYYGASELSYVSYIQGKDIRKYPDAVGKPFPGVKVSIENDMIYVDTPYRAEGVPAHHTCYDLGSTDEEGRIHYLGRREDVYNIKGNHVSRQKVLSHLLIVEGVWEAELLLKGGKLTAFIVGDEGLTAKKMNQQLKALYPFELPDRYVFLKEIPKMSTGKTNKKILLSME